jgi:hypothetical protein
MSRRPLGRLAAVGVPVLCAALIITSVAASSAASPRPERRAPTHSHAHPLVLAPVAAPKVDTAEPLHPMAGTVAIDRTRTVRPAGKLSAAGAPTAAALAATTKVGLRALVVAVDSGDFGVPTWRATLDRVGAAYDVLYTKITPLTASTLVRPDTAGRYNAILLTSSALLYFDGTAYVSGLDSTEWNTLWAYERDYAVRQVALYASYGTWPESYCLAGSSEGGVGDTPLLASLTATGAGVFDYLNPSALVPITQSYVYRTRIPIGCNGSAVLTNGADVLGVRSTSVDGRQLLALTFTSNQYLLQADLLTYGLLRWASRGLFLGEQRHFLNVDVDDWFNTADHYFPDGHIQTDPGYQVSGHDAYNLNQRQTALRTSFPLAAGFTLNLALNGGDADLTAGTACSPNGDIDTLTATTRCLSANFRWVNHTLTHPELNFTNYATSANEISANRTVASTLGLSSPDSVLKTGEYSGLGVYNNDPNNDVDPPTDHGLGASNTALLTAARDLGVRYVHGNMSFPSHVPSCFNCGIVHPLQPALTIVPDWPTNIAYHTTEPAEETAFYNSFYGPSGRFPYWPANLTYNQIIDYEAGVALSHLTTGSIYSHTLHIANIRDYGAGRTLLTDWLSALFTKYSALYAVPILNPDWPGIGAYATGRIGHFAELAGGVDAVYDSTTGSITVSSPLTGKVTVSGSSATGHSTYGTDVSSVVTVTAGASVTVPASPRP